MVADKNPLKIEDLNANHCAVAVHKYGFFLCTNGWSKILLGTRIYNISSNMLCIYTPNTFFQILEKSSDLDGILEEDDVDAYYQVVSSIDIQTRLQIRDSPCVEISKDQSDMILQLFDLMRIYGKNNNEFKVANQQVINPIKNSYLRYFRYVLCLKILEVYFVNTPVDALPRRREDMIINNFLVSLYDNCHSQRSVEYYASEQNLSPYYFSSIIKSCSGKSAMQWIESVTMTFARQYLECTELSIKEISDRLNFPDQSTFGRYFKRHEGCSPSDFRRRKESDNKGLI